jgi:uncharacterized protein (TIGR03663 family)
VKWVPTGSTKRRRHKAGSAAKAEIKTASTASPAVAARLPDRLWWAIALSILLVGAVLRLYDLDLVPLHHDEGVNGNFLVRLVREGVYRYDPANYHGPTLYYFSAVIPWAFRFLFGPSAQNTYGLTTFTIRLIPALFGLGTIWLIFVLRRRVGDLGTLAAAGLLAISPGAVYLSRYFIHETLFVFFTLGIVVALIRFYEDGSNVYLILASVSAALLFATKETSIISAAVLLIAFITTHVYLRMRKGERGKAYQSVFNLFETLSNRAGGKQSLFIWLLIAIAAFVGINVLFYSSFFTNFPKGVSDSLATFQFWMKTGSQAHVHPKTRYISWLIDQEFSLIFLGVIGAALAVWKPRRAFALFCALWAFGLIAAYSLIAYKTPWLILNFIVPLALISGYVFQFLAELAWIQFRELIVLAAVAVAISGYNCLDLNFRNYDNDDTRYVYVYAHTRRETLKLVDDINRIAKMSGQGGQTGITIVSRDYWPLPWYLRDYTRVGYFGQLTDSNELMIIASEEQRSDVEERFGFRYQQVPSGLNQAGSYSLRPGVNLLLYVRKDQSAMALPDLRSAETSHFSSSKVL